MKFVICYDCNEAFFVAWTGKNANRIGDSVCVWLSYNHSLGEKKCTYQQNSCDFFACVRCASQNVSVSECSIGNMAENWTV